MADVIMGPLSLASEDEIYVLDLHSHKPKGSMDLENHPCEIVWKHQHTGIIRTFGTYPSWSIAIWVLFRIEDFFPNGSRLDVPRFLRGVRKICAGYETLARHIQVPKIKLSKMAAQHAAKYIASEGLRNFSHRLMLGRNITVIYESGGDSVHLSTGQLYCQKKYDDDGNVTEYHVRFRRHRH